MLQEGLMKSYPGTTNLPGQKFIVRNNFKCAILFFHLVWNSRKNLIERVITLITIIIFHIIHIINRLINTSSNHIFITGGVEARG